MVSGRLMFLLFVLQHNHTWMAHMDYEASCRKCTDTHHSDPRYIPTALLLTEGAASATQPVNHTTLDPQRAPGGVADETDSVAMLQVLLPMSTGWLRGRMVVVVRLWWRGRMVVVVVRLWWRCCHVADAAAATAARNTGEFAWSGRTGVGDSTRYSTLAIINIFLHQKYLLMQGIFQPI